MPETPLIVGAGPTGLAAALFLRERGIPARIIDSNAEPSIHSKALGVNSRTLDLLESTGVTEAMLAHGQIARTMNLWRPDRKLATINLGGIDHPYPFMLILSQAESERLLTEALAERNITVERGVELTDINAGDSGIAVTLSSGEALTPSVVLGADGAHSTVRKTLGRGFPGSSYPEPWYLCDARLTTTLDPTSPHAFLLDEGALLFFPIKGDLWRIVSNVAAPLSHAPAGTTIGTIEWESDFGFSHRIADPLCADNVCLAGDAAHIHSAVGARGMNLGIEDAYVFAALVAENRIADYEALRRPVIESVVKTVARATELPRGRTMMSKIVRRVPSAIAWLAPKAEHIIRPWVLGLDHEIGVD
jgi:2-polyprenyl-6-methoxyphenol hydroxylase-like FAD-dependent oxidoreductase